MTEGEPLTVNTVCVLNVFVVVLFVCLLAFTNSTYFKHTCISFHGRADPLASVRIICPV